MEIATKTQSEMYKDLKHCFDSISIIHLRQIFPVQFAEIIFSDKFTNMNTHQGAKIISYNPIKRATKTYCSNAICQRENNHLDKYKTIIVNKYGFLFFNIKRVGTAISCCWSCQ